MKSAIVLIIVAISGVFFVQSLDGVWSSVNVPRPYLEAYEYLQNSTGVTILVPSSYSIETPFYQKNLTIFWNHIAYFNTPTIFYYAYPASWIGQAQAGSSQPYAQMYNALYGGNRALFQSLAKELDIQYILYFSPSTVLYEYGSLPLPLHTLLEDTGFVIAKNFSSNLILLEDPNFTEKYKMSLVWGRLIFNFSKPESTFLSPTPYEAGLSTYPASNLTDYQGLAVFKLGHPSLTLSVSSEVVTYNIISEAITAIFIAFSFAYYFVKQFRKKPQSSDI